MRIKLQRLRQSSRSSSPTNTHSKDENETSGKIAIADVIAIYADDRGSEIARDKELYARLARLDNFWANRTLAEINGETCREYVRVRDNSSGTRRELEDPRGAINHHSREGYHGALSAFSFPRRVTPEQGGYPARRLPLCYGRAGAHEKRRPLTEDRRQTSPSKQTVDRFAISRAPFLMGLYTGTRSGAISQHRPSASGRSFVDLPHGVL